jgi:hypothetical protein
MISEPMVHLAQNRSLTLTLSPNAPQQESTSPRSSRSSIGASKIIFEPMERLAQTVHLSCIKISTISKRTETSFHLPHHLGVLLRASTMISEPMVCLAQTVHLYCTDTNTVSKQTKMRFDMTHSPKSAIVCVYYDFRAYGTFSTNRAPILHQD